MLIGDIAVLEELRDSVQIDFGRKSTFMQRTRCGSEGELFASHGIQERLHAQAVAKERQLAVRRIPNADGKHPPQLREHLLHAPMPVSVNQNLGVRTAPKGVAGLFEFPAQLKEVIDSSIKYDADLTIPGKHRLIAQLTQVEDRQAAMTQHRAG